MTKKPPSQLIDWLGQPWRPGSATPAAHPNSRFTAPASQCPVIDPSWEDPSGVPISALIFGGRRSSVMPLVYEALDWNHGTFLGCSVSSETTAAAAGEVGKLRHDPFAMLPFCGYNMADYFGHWLKMGQQKAGQMVPRIYCVNWFRKSPEGQFLWPGFGENIRVLKWIFERAEGKGEAVEAPIGYLPTEAALDRSGLNVTSEDMRALLSIDAAAWLHEMEEMQRYLTQFGQKLPLGITEQLKRIEKRLKQSM